MSAGKSPSASRISASRAGPRSRAGDGVGQGAMLGQACRLSSSEGARMVISQKRAVW